MDARLYYTAGISQALEWAVGFLKKAGCSFCDCPEKASHYLLPVPTPPQLLDNLPGNSCVIGGPVIDLLKDPDYVAENAYITAHCATKLLMEKLCRPLRGCPILVIGWGRIGKCLASMLRALEADVTVAARKESDRAMLKALGYRAVSTEALCPRGYRGILNTAPAMLLPDDADCIQIELASSPGLGGSKVISARGLPGKMAPEASGELIARRIIYYLNKE